MPKSTATVLTPRKLPRQLRSKVTVDAIFEATIQVLLTVGAEKLTTTKVADRAGVSVGTLYQYYPNKQALLFGALLRHLSRIEQAVTECAHQVHGMPLPQITVAITESFVRAKMANIEEARALDQVSSRLDATELCRKATIGGQVVLSTLLRSAADVTFDDPDLVSFVWLNTMIGLARGFLEGEPALHDAEKIEEQLKSLCCSYVERGAIFLIDTASANT